MISKFKNIIKELYFDSRYKPTKVLFYIKYFVFQAQHKYIKIALLRFDSSCPISIKEYLDKTIYNNIYSKQRMKDI